MVLLTALKLMVKSVLYVGIFCLIIMCTPGLGPHVTVTDFKLEPAVKLEGKLAPLNVLDKAEAIIDGGKAEGVKIIAPESVAVFPDESIYSGIEGGSIIRYKNGQTSVISMGKDCDPWESHVCGRALGMREHKGRLLVADAYHGIYHVDVETGERESLFPFDQAIEGKVPRLADDVDVTKDGIVYWSDASTNADLDNGVLEFMGPPSGRLIQFDPKTKKNTVLIDAIHFANGVQLSPNEDFVLVSESMRARILRYHLKGPKKGQSDVFVDGLPGFPDNLRSNGKGGYYIAIIAKRDVADQLGPWPSVRKIALRVRHLILSTLSLVQDYVLPGNRKVSEIKLYVTKMPFLVEETHALIVEVDGNGNILRALQSKDTKMMQISQMSVSKKFAYFGSPYTKQLWRIKLSDLN